MKRTLLLFGIFVTVLTTGDPRSRLAGQVQVATLTGPAVLDDWGARFTALGASVPENALRTQIRTTIAQMAMFDAVNAVLDGPYRPFASKPPSLPGASPEAAAIRAAYIVALNEFPAKSVDIETAYEVSIAGVPASPEAIASGVVVGEAAANAALDARVGDHRNDPELEGYTPGSGPGVWVPTPPASANPQTPFLQYVTPFGYDDPARFRPKSPPALGSRTYTTDYNELKDVGRATDSSRTAEQSATALFWSPSASALWTANIRSLAGSMDLLTAARFEAVGIAAVTNALIGCWDAKYTYMFWRPVTAIRAADIDGNPATDPETGWVPFIVTPSHPEYPGAHSTVGAAALGFYTVWFGTDQFPLAFKGNGGAVRYYTSARQIHAEEGNARVWGGMHWRHSTRVGTALGSRIGEYTATHLLKQLDE
ncbi:MAG TPA: vanadium-dependent haloperoxidase [Vicinamibacterales bacterium]|nr:vanadium-dependent haloperoxidase [Vicinamibacterales bacterium]